MRDSLKFCIFCFFAGDIIYNVTDGFGWCFTAYCNSTCHIVKISTSCETTPSPSISPETTTYSSASTISTTKPVTLISTTNTNTEEITTTFWPRCDALDPPRQVHPTSNNLVLYFINCGTLIISRAMALHFNRKARKSKINLCLHLTDIFIKSNLHYITYITAALDNYFWISN